MKRHPLLILCLLAVSLLGSFVQAQAWNTNTITATAPSTCTSGQPIANCAVTGYRFERSATQNGTYASVGTSPTPTFTHLGAAAGLNCYRVVALSAQGESAPSIVTSSACRTNVEPSGPPNPPTGVTVITPTVYNVTPNLQRFTFERGSRYPALAKVGAACDERRCTADGYCVVSRLTQVTPRPASGTVLLARCG